MGAGAVQTLPEHGGIAAVGTRWANSYQAHRKMLERQRENIHWFLSPLPSGRREPKAQPGDTAVCGWTRAGEAHGREIVEVLPLHWGCRRRRSPAPIQRAVGAAGCNCWPCFSHGTWQLGRGPASVPTGTTRRGRCCSPSKDSRGPCCAVHFSALLPASGQPWAQSAAGWDPAPSGGTRTKQRAEPIAHLLEQERDQHPPTQRWGHATGATPP